MLTRLRRKLSSVVEPVAARFARLASANSYTALGLVAAGFFALLCWAGLLLYALLSLLISGFLDALDGAVARLRGESSRRGALLDSTADRLSDVAYSVGLLFLGYSPLLALLFAAGSLMVSYVRARFEAIAERSMEGVGLMERAERVIALALVVILHMVCGQVYGELALAAATVLVWLSLVQRVVHALRELE
ncbi:MAG: CDP-alcohol phosphatidyltransferase family protein [Thermoproteota archaeon]